MATVRIYKVAELLNTSSQEVLALLKRAHGIELKSASSTIEEVVARQFVERLARERNITLPGGDMFAEGPVVEARRQEAGASAKKPEPAKPAAPTLAPPRLVKTSKPAAPAATAVEEPLEEETPAAPVEEPEEEPAPAAEAPSSAAAAATTGQPEAADRLSKNRRLRRPQSSRRSRPDRPPHDQRPPHLLRHRGPRLRRDAWCRRASD